MQYESVTIDQLIAAHWGPCDVGTGETPEAYASRHEEQDRPLIGRDLAWYGCEVLSFQFIEGRVVLLAIPPAHVWRLKESR